MYEYTVTFEISDMPKTYDVLANEEYGAVAAAALNAALDVAAVGLSQGANPVDVIEGMARMFAGGEITIEL